MRHVAIALLALAVSTSAVMPALAQNPVQIQHARGGAGCAGCNLFQGDFANLELNGKSFSHARLRQADMSAAVLTHDSFARADLRDVNAYGAVFTGTSFAGADLTNASFVGAYLQGANLSGARLDGVNLSGAEMDRAIGLTQHQLDGACGDASSVPPRGMRLHPCR